MKTIYTYSERVITAVTRMLQYEFEYAGNWIDSNTLELNPTNTIYFGHDKNGGAEDYFTIITPSLSEKVELCLDIIFRKHKTDLFEGL